MDQSVGQPGAGPSYPGYMDLLNKILGGIQGVGQSQSQAIQDTYQQQSGQAKQDMISKGLGNSTVASSVQRGLTLDKSKADVALQNQLAQLSAGYTAQLGMSGLQQQGQYQQQQNQYAFQQQQQAQQHTYGLQDYAAQNPLSGYLQNLGQTGQLGWHQTGPWAQSMFV